jgi:hypothetical protein
VESAPIARFHRVGEVFPDALYGHIIITFDLAVLRGQMKDLQEGISYRRERATPKHRDLYNVLEDNLVVGNQDLESDRIFFVTAERKERTFLWNRMEEISSKAAVNDTLRPIRAIIKIATTITAHRLARAVMDLVNIQKVVSDYAERLEEDGWYIELDECRMCSI